ncbi:hypothetical protein LEN26_014529 [Aphanomyces euteiches]|nr:hypothetical protein LEN26_014529 [Aphanomyces euteiches]KAH9191139.1 hypothetical protein AeNC1_006880 [Aphanomyces euteiches]
METSSTTLNGPALKKRKTQVRFNSESDLALVKETIARNPYAAEFGKKREVWDEVASAVGAHFAGLDIDGRRCRERCMLLSDTYAKHQKTMETMSGVEEEIAEIDEYLAEILELREEESRRASNRKQAMKSKEQIDQDIGAAIRDEAMKAMSQRKKKDVSKSFNSDLVEIMARRDTTAKEIEENRLRIEERRLAIEEKRAASEEQRYELEKQERIALLNLIGKLVDKPG